MQHFQRQLDHGTNNDHLEKPKFEIKINFKVRSFLRLNLEIPTLKLDFTLKLDHYKEKNYIVTLIRFRNIREINDFIVSLVIYSLKL